MDLRRLPPLQVKGDLVGRSRVRAACACLGLVVAAATATAEAEAAYPGADGQVVFSVFAGGLSNIAAVNPDGSGYRLLTDDAQSTCPSVSADGSQVVYEHASRGRRHIWVMGFDGSNKRQLTSGRTIDSCPQFSPDGSRIVFERTNPKGLPSEPGTPQVPGDYGDIWTMKADGSGAVNLTGSGDVDDHDPTWAANGSKIAWVHEAQRNGAFTWSMNPDGSGAHEVVELFDYPDISPDSDQLAGDWIGSGPGLTWIIQSADLDNGANRDFLSDGGKRNNAGDLNPVWSPSGQFVAFSRTDSYERGGDDSQFFGDATLMKLNVASGSVSPVIELPRGLDADEPSWQPLTAGSPAPPTTDNLGPGVAGLRLRPKPVRRVKPVKVSWIQFERAPATLTIKRGGKGGKRLLGRKRFGKARAGANKARLRRLPGKVLKRGRYTAELVAVDAAGNKSTTTTRFRVR